MKFKETSLKTAYLISKSNKVFICFDSENDKITNYILTNDLNRHRVFYEEFGLVQKMKIEVTVIFNT